MYTIVAKAKQSTRPQPRGRRRLRRFRWLHWYLHKLPGPCAILPLGLQPMLIRLRVGGSLEKNSARWVNSLLSRSTGGQKTHLSHLEHCHSCNWSRMVPIYCHPNLHQSDSLISSTCPPLTRVICLSLPDSWLRSVPPSLRCFHYHLCSDPNSYRPCVPV
ncbi:hypothetical protein BGZ63DRAFT_121926 [Mariannaea sp. PMI_226]|nr:hypothetical protein BGZ63DRAFT_121926 [Mariannaea sp. PMI_226]